MGRYRDYGIGNIAEEPTMSIASNPRSNAEATPMDRLRQGLVIVALALTLYVNYLANALPIGGRGTGEISDSLPNSFTPAGYVFAIWGVIYLGLIAFAIYQARPSLAADARLRSIGWIFVLSCFFNSAWIFAWHYGRLPLSLFLMLGILGCLIAIYLRLHPKRREGSGIAESDPAGLERPTKGASAAARWAVELPFSIYLGWISVATIANVTVLLSSRGWDGWGIAPPVWSAIVLVVGAVIGMLMARRHRDAAVVAVIVWAYGGVVVAHSETPIVAVTAALMVPFVVFALLRAPQA
jgi:benzodiazapine receptor